MSNIPLDEKEAKTHIQRSIFDYITEIEKLLLVEGQEQKGGKPLWWYEIADTLKTFREACHKSWKEQRLQIAVLALIKSGKSTFINSWLGNEFLPISSQAETARIVRIKHQPHNISGILRDGTTIIHGAKAICDYLRSQNAQVRAEKETSISREVILEAPLLLLKDHPLGEIQFEILDTPGPNEAGIKQLWQYTKPFIQRVDMIFYLLDAAKLKTTEEQRIFEDISAMRQDLLINKQIYFILNKIDLMNRNSFDYREMADYVAALLRRQIQNLHITADQILFISAEEALLARLVQHTNVSAGVLEDFARRVFGEVEISSISDEKYRNAAPRLLEKSQIYHLEEAILSRILSQQEMILFKKMFSSLERLINQFYTHLLTIYERLVARQANLNAWVEQLEFELATIPLSGDYPAGIAQSLKRSQILKNFEEKRVGESHRMQRTEKLRGRLEHLAALSKSLSYHQKHLLNEPTFQ